ncbi:ATP-dependent zinc metalloprotease FtsH [Buchnera aphidicola (Cinara piceae)]|uniref:ATP-dependent zinc metalloprotease FtsH n=1 Tax=Buchnera aphidicola (Cinara piceae) TaxID=1660043 RepID=A0A803FU12_9GAMM|nr:ATP-dependent zinc metalloprotease FtsH [Buchnera aphidicola]VFP88453.1 ATP-dependent zinc metalloprotease FtsH [Buchnera aphidicola (Cinara piceae)]
MTNTVKNFIIWTLILIIGISLFQKINNYYLNNYEVDYSTFLIEVNRNKIREARINGKQIIVIRKDLSQYTTYIPINDSRLLDILLNHKVSIIGVHPKGRNIILSVFISCLPSFFSTCILFFFINQVYINGGKGIFLFGKSKAKMLLKNKGKITFSDIAGCEEAKEDVSEVVDYLKEPKRFKKLGGKIPKGILMVGPPGTGKTLLAKAIAGEANVPFFSISGSDFVEMFVGVGASRVRDMFENSRKYAPCIIFIDEIDAIGRKRGININNSHSEQEQTLNQILVEMDGFEGNEGVILIAATNRPDVLDPALLRPGRFDRQVTVSLPDIKGREEILKIHMRKILVSNDVIPIILARSTPGFSGADLANLVNEAALLAARFNKTSVTMSDFEKSRDKITMGSEKKSLMITESQKEYTAYHEAGHVIVGRLVPEHDPIHKVTIIPRGDALGITLFLPSSDMCLLSRKKLESKISTLYGGRLAEELIYGSTEVTTGSYSDIAVATRLARKMVTQWGFSEKLGPLLYKNEDKEFFLGQSITKNKYISDKTTQIIDEEIKLLININYERARKILNENIDILHAMKDALMKYETLDSLQINDLMSRKLVRIPDGWHLR